MCNSNMSLENDITWTNIISILALVVSIIVLVVAVYFSRKSLKNSTDVLNVSKQQIKQISYFQVIDIIRESKKGYDAFPKLRTFLDSYAGVWIDDKIRQYVNNKSEEIKQFEENSEFSIPEPEPDMREFTDEEIEQVQMDELEEIANMSREERYDYEFDQRFHNVKDEFLRLLNNELKKETQKLNND